VANFGAAAVVQDQNQTVHRAIPRKKLSLLVAGDQVTCEGPNLKELRIVRLHPRQSVLERPDRRQAMRPLAANLTRMVVVSAIIPAPETLLIDQFCIVAESVGVEAIVLVNKSDLGTEEELDTHRQMLAVYQNLGYQTALINTRSSAGLQPLHDLLSDQCSVFVGQSGVGKSSIIQAILPDQEIRIGAISKATGVGAHTTTVSFRYELEGGGVLIDSPGVRQFPVEHLSTAQLADGYREIRALAEHCRFSDCTHRVEPDCAVTAAVGTGEVASARYQNYSKLIQR